MSSPSLGRRLLAGMTGVVSVGALVLALLNPGVESTEVDLNDGGVWVTNSQLRLVAHVNFPARLMDAGLRTSSSAMNVFQTGEDVFVSDAEAGSLASVDVANSALGVPVDYAGLSTFVSSSTVALSDSAAGKVWVQSADAMSPVNTEEDEPAIDGMPGVVATVGLDGSVHAVSPSENRLVSLVSRGELVDKSEVKFESAPLAADSKIQISAVGSEPVVLERDSGRLHFANGSSVEVEGSGLTLQEPGPTADKVLVASDSALIEVPLGGGNPIVYEAGMPGGVPSRPARHMGCVYGAWSATGAFLRQCADGEPERLTVDTMKSAEQALFRVNRDVIVLNDVKSGGVWLPEAQMVLVDNWDQIESTIESDEESDKESPDLTNETLLPERPEENTPPVAVNDDFGVRPGRVSILPVLNNDSDPDGDFLTAAPASKTPLGEVSVSRDGSALQINVPAEATGASTFDYEVSDGRGGTAKATVVLKVRSAEENSAPVQSVVPSISLGTGRKATINALTSWHDPDGDPFFLERAVAPSGISAQTHVNGSIDLQEIGHGPGKDSVQIFVSDGRDTGQGEISVSVRDSGNEPPVANADHVVVRQGSSITLSPLANDTDPNGDSLRLVQIENSPAGVTATMDGASGTISIEGGKVGTYYLGYVVTDGPATGPGVIRIDVIEPGLEAPPSAEPDLGVLPDGGQVIIDLLANDSDPTGGVLTVQNLDVSSSSRLVVALINHQMVRVTAPRGLDAPESFSYTVSNGVASASATVTVVPHPAQTGQDPPELQEDHLIVRAGDIASVSVLDNDRSPAGLKMTVSNDLQHEIKPDLASVFISDNVVRVRGGERGGSGKIVYTVHDAMGNVASSVVNLVVVAKDADNNTAPRPKDLTARTVAGREVDIRVPLENIDPEGDSVSLVGLAGAPKLGTVTSEGSVLRYTASADARGTDSFTYLVEDRLGKQATATVRVGIAPRAATNQSPVALPDQVQVRPATRVAVAVLSNDIDPDGDDVVLEKDSLSSQTPDLQISERSGRVVVVAPETEGTHVISYGVTDRKGGSARGLLTVVVRKEAPELAPIARDDSVSNEALQAGQNNTVIVPVLANDEDPDGDIADVTITTPDANVHPNMDGTVAVTLTNEPQLLIYTLTDASNKQASAVIRVPGVEIVRPTVDTTTVPIKAKAGETKEIRINDHIRTRSGRSVMITAEQKVSAGLGANGDPLVKDPTTLVFTAREDFSGLTSITLEVTDGKDLNDSEGRTAIITLPIEVEPIENRPPTVTPTGMQVAPGEEAATTNLALMVTDPDNDNPTSMTYSLAGSAPSGLTASISGTTLSVSAPADAPRGNAGSIRVKVDDGRGGSAEADVPVTVVSSSRPLIQTSDAQVTLDAAKSTTVDITQYATNPFTEQGAITLVGQPTASEGGSVTANGTQLTINANAGFNGTFTVTYTVVDATKDPSREVRGIVTATVRDKPGAPSDVTAVSNSSGTAQVSWTAGPANGTPITTFTVTDHTQGDSMPCGLVTTCLFPNRQNGIEHSFSVTATNEVGVSDPSGQATTMIDIEPEAPAVPTLTEGDRTITVTWQPPHNEGSALIDYEVTLSPAGTQTIPAGQTTATFTGLNNGAEYVATVRARNGKGSSPLSQASPAKVPYGAPGPVSNVTANYASLGTGTGSVATVVISWDPPSNTNGRAIEFYFVTNGHITKTVGGTETSTTIEGVRFASEQMQFTVTATNNSDNSPYYTSPPMSVNTWVVGQPLPPTITGIQATGNDNQVQISYTPSPAGQGWNSEQLRYEWSAGGAWNRLDGNIVTGDGLANGQASNVRIRAVGEKTGSLIYSPEITSQAVTPFGPPRLGSISCQPSDQAEHLNCYWSDASAGGRDANTDIMVEVTGRPTETVPFNPSGSVINVHVGRGAGRMCLTIYQNTDEAGKRSERNCSDYVETKRKVGTWFTHQYGEPTMPSSPCFRSCQWLRHEVSGWEANSRVRCSGIFTDSAGRTFSAATTVTTDGNGWWAGVAFWQINGRSLRLIYNSQQYSGTDYFSSLSCGYE